MTLTVDSSAASEAAATVVTVTATLSAAIDSEQSVNLQITGVDSTDYQLSNTVFTFAAGQLSATLNFTVLDDAITENTETAALSLSSPSSGISLGTTISQNIELIDNDVTITRIPVIQGNGAAVTDTVTEFIVDAIVTESYQSTLQGFFIQEESEDADASVGRSSGIFVYCGTCTVAVAAGDKVRVTAKASEFNGMSQLSATTANSVNIISSNNALPPAAHLVLPVPAEFSDKDAYLEAFEGMLITVDTRLTVIDTEKLGRFGELTLSSNSSPWQFTQNNQPNATAYSAYLAELARQTLILDDSSNAQNPEPIVYPQNDLSAANSLRLGSTLTQLTGVLHWSWGGNSSSPNAWRVRPLAGQNYNFNLTTRPNSPATFASGTVKIASVNLHNYFNTFTNCPLGINGASADSYCRGAENATEFSRQQDKIKSVFTGLNADVIGVMELQNNGYAADSAQQNLLNLINSLQLTGRSYALVDADTYIGASNAVGTDAIKVGFLYDNNALELVTTSVKTAQQTIFERRPLAATFIQRATGEKFTVVVNHFKSKASAGNLTGDSDQGDGQGLSNATRVAQAQALSNFLDTLNDDSDILVIGDFNAYAQEEPLQVIEQAGYSNLISAQNYSYVFDGQKGSLDHAFASASLASAVAGTSIWHINADEPAVLDYNTNYKSSTQQVDLYSTDAYRASDHDPLLIALQFTAHYNLTVVAGNAGGTVSSSGTPQGTSCGANCLRYVGNTAVTLHASPAANYTFSGWSCSPSFNSGDALNANTTCTASFTATPTPPPVINPPSSTSPTYYTLSLSSSGTGSGQLSGTATGSYPQGKSIKLVATASADSEFTGWSPTNCANSFYLQANTECVAYFNLKTNPTSPLIASNVSLTLQTQGTGQGTIQGTAAGEYLNGTLVQLTAIAAMNSTFSGWTPSHCNAFNLLQNTVCVANFSLNQAANTPPFYQRTLADLVVTEGDAGQIINLANAFIDAEDTVLQYQVVSSEPQILKAELQKNLLLLQFVQQGSSLLTITAVDSSGLTATATFLVTIGSRTLTPPPVIMPMPELPSCEPVEHYRGTCNGGGVYLKIHHLTAEAVIANFIVNQSLENQGFISDIIVDTRGIISGGVVSGQIYNKGIIRDVEFKGKSLNGGTLGGYIRNSSPVYGKIYDVQFEPCAMIEGGYWGGQLKGQAAHPVYLNYVTLAADSYLENAILGQGVKITGSSKHWQNVYWAREMPKNHFYWNLQTIQASSACFAAMADSEIAFVIRPEIAHIGKTAELLSLLIDEQQQHYSFKQHWLAIPAELEKIQTFSTLKLPPVLTIPNSLLQTLPPAQRLYLAYRLANGWIVYGQLPILGE